jgi:hypothetical protein
MLVAFIPEWSLRFDGANDRIVILNRDGLLRERRQAGAV